MGYATQSIGNANQWSPTWTGFSADPTAVTSRYILIGKFCTITVWTNSVGTSNATTLTVTLPFPAKSTTRMACNVLNNGTQTNGLFFTTAGSNIGTAYATVAAGAFTASGGKFVYLTGFCYEVE